MPLAKDLLHPSPEEEKRKHKKKRLVQSPNSYFMDVKCPGCYKITTVFSHAQTVVLCVGCLLFSASLQEEKQGLQKDALSDGSSAKSPLYQDERGTIPINTFWIQKKKRKKETIKIPGDWGEPSEGPLHTNFATTYDSITISK